MGESERTNLNLWGKQLEYTNTSCSFKIMKRSSNCGRLSIHFNQPKWNISIKYILLVISTNIPKEKIYFI